MKSTCILYFVVLLDNVWQGKKENNFCTKDISSIVMGMLFFVDFDTIAGIKCCCRQDSFSVIGPKKTFCSLLRLNGWLRWKSLLLFYPLGWWYYTFVLMSILWNQKKMLVNMFLFHQLFSMTLEKTSHKYSIQYTTYGIGLFHLLCFKPKTFFKDLPILMRKLLLFLRYSSRHSNY